MRLNTVPKPTNPGCLDSSEKPARPVLHHAPVQRTHVSTEEAASLLLVDAKTLLKSHSLRQQYGGIRPVRLPSRKLAWPLAEIEKLLNGASAAVVMEGA